MIRGSQEAYRRAKRLRRQMSLPEVLLWQQLRRNQTGFHWRKQHPAGEYDLDFYCDAAKLCVEVDSEAHAHGHRPERDAERDRFMERNGILTLRVSAVDVLGNLESVVTHIVTQAHKRAPLHRLRRSPSPASWGRIERFAHRS